MHPLEKIAYTNNSDQLDLQEFFKMQAYHSANNFFYFKLIRKKDKSVYESLNYACKIAKGDYISFLHSGDVYIQDNILNKVYNIQ